MCMFLHLFVGGVLKFVGGAARCFKIKCIRWSLLQFIQPKRILTIWNPSSKIELHRFTMHINLSFPAMLELHVRDSQFKICRQISHKLLTDIRIRWMRNFRRNSLAVAIQIYEFFVLYSVLMLNCHFLFVENAKYFEK